MAPRIVLWLACTISIFVLPSWAAVLAIDYGTDWIKASLMKPGAPFDILLNKDSKRKIHASVAWNREDRLFGGDAFNLATRFPRDSFSGLKHIMGVKYDKYSTKYFKQFSQNTLRKSPRGTISLERSNADATVWTPEELIAMELAYVKQLAEEANNGPVTEVVVTVPGHFNQAQRLSMLDAIEIAGLKSIALLNDGSAVAYNYAMTRSFPEKEHHLIFDAGAGSIRATLASFHSPDAKPEDGSKKKKKSTIKNPTKDKVDIEILAVGYDTTASGNELTKRIRDTFVTKFEKQHGKSLAENDRALARLWKEAERVKAILSANADATSNVESLHDDIDFKTKTLRSDFEKDCDDLKWFFAKPLEDALEIAKLDWENITSVILMGGHSRVPMVQAAIKELNKDVKISQNINTDEAAVLGAVFYGASMSPSFKTKKIVLTDVAVRDIRVEYEVEGKDSGRKIMGHFLWRANDKTGDTRTLGFKNRESFSLNFLYETPGIGILEEIGHLNIPKIAPAMNNLTDRGVEEPVVKFNVTIDETTGIMKITNVFAWGDVPVSEEAEDESLSGKIKNFFGGGSSSESSTASDASATPTTTSSTAAETPSTSVKAKRDPRNDPNNIVPVAFTYKYRGIVSYTTEQKAESKAKLASLEAAEKAQEKHAEAYNVLEAYIYKFRDLLNDDDSSAQVAFREYSTEDERAALHALVETTSEWLTSSAGHSADTAELKEKKKALRSLEAPISIRQKEAASLPRSFSDLREAIEKARTFIKTAHTDLSKNKEAQQVIKTPEEGAEADAESKDAESTAELPYTPEEIQELVDLVNEAADFLKEKEAEDEETPKNVSRSFRANELDKKGLEVQRATIRLTVRRKDRKLKTSTTTFSSSGSKTTASTESTTTPAAEEPTHSVKDEL